MCSHHIFPSPTTMDITSEVTTSFALGKLSFPHFLNKRRESVETLKKYVNQLPIPSNSRSFLSKDRHSIFIGSGIRHWPEEAPKDIQWLSTPPTTGVSTFPVLLDVAESATHVIGGDVISLLCEALAPSWNQLGQFGLTNPSLSHPRWDDIDGDAEDLIARFLLTAAAKILASFGASYGLILRNPENFDHSGRMFLARLIDEASLTGFNLAIDTTEDFDPQLQYLHVKNFRLVHNKLCRTPSVDLTNPIVKLVALSPQGLPAWLVEKLGFQCNAASLPTCIGPQGDIWMYVPRQLQSATRNELSADEESNLHGLICRAWEKVGWNYLRGGAHRVMQGDGASLLIDHTSYVYGMRELGRSSLYRHYIQLLELAPHLMSATGRVNTLVCTARLCASVYQSEGNTLAVRYYRRALKDADSDAATAVDIIYAIVNSFARQRSPAFFNRAKQWHKRGLRLLDKIKSKDVRLFAEIRLTNVLALVEYRAGNNDTALLLERRALSIAEEASTEYPSIGAWALPILRANLARLLEQRFCDPISAIELLENNLLEKDANFQEHARIELARLYWDRGNFRRVIDLLSDHFERGWSLSLNEDREYFAQVALFTALLLTGETTRASAQSSKLAYLNAVKGTNPKSDLNLNTHGLNPRESVVLT